MSDLEDSQEFRQQVARREQAEARAAEMEARYDRLTLTVARLDAEVTRLKGGEGLTVYELERYGAETDDGGFRTVGVYSTPQKAAEAEAADKAVADAERWTIRPWTVQ